MKRPIINIKNLKLDYNDPDSKAYGDKLPYVNEKVMGLKNTLKKGKEALNRGLSAPSRAVVGAYRESKLRGQDRTYKAYKMVNDADKAGVKAKGNESDPLFRARTSMRAEHQRQALERKKI